MTDQHTEAGLSGVYEEINDARYEGLMGRDLYSVQYRGLNSPVLDNGEYIHPGVNNPGISASRHPRPDVSCHPMPSASRHPRSGGNRIICNDTAQIKSNGDGYKKAVARPRAAHE